jgi:hypothetical protein
MKKLLRRRYVAPARVALDRIRRTDFGTDASAFGQSLLQARQRSRSFGTRGEPAECSAPRRGRPPPKSDSMSDSMPDSVTIRILSCELSPPHQPPHIPRHRRPSHASRHQSGYRGPAAPGWRPTIAWPRRFWLYPRHFRRPERQPGSAATGAESVGPARSSNRGLGQ